MGQAAATMQGKPQTFRRQRLLPGAYSLDLAAVRDTPLQMDGQPSTFVEVYCKLRDSKIREIRSLIEHTYVTEEGEIHLDGNIEEWPLRATMHELAELLLRGIDPHDVTWFYYTHDRSRDDDEVHTFFVVHDGKVILESCSFNSEEPLVLKRSVADDPVWQSHRYFDEAFEIYWYRKFYTETMTGQLMVLRPDEPTLYHYERQQTRNVQGEVQSATQVKIHRLLLVALPLLVALVFPSLKEYMAIAASVLGASFLWLCWATRKAGQQE